MPLQGEYEPSPTEWVRHQVEEYESSGGTRGTTMRGLPVIILTSVGAKSGKLRKTPLMRVEKGGEYLVAASKGGADTHPVWYHNLIANPHVELQDGPVRKDYDAVELSGAERQEWWDRAVAEFPDYAEYQQNTDRVIPILLLRPRSE